VNNHHWKNELANTVTHGLGVAASIAALCILVVMAARGGDPWEVVGVSIFGATLILLYLASTLYHAVAHPNLKSRLKVLDHCAIYLLIAGSYTPFMIGVLRGGWGWSMFGVIVADGFDLAGCGRGNLHGRHDLLPQRAVPACPCGLAFIRARRQRLPRFGGGRGPLNCYAAWLPQAPEPPVPPAS
jgi:hypothetical protein